MDIICNVVNYIHGIGGLLFYNVTIGANLLTIFGRMPWSALFSPDMFIAVFFGASKIVRTITGKETCCFYEKQMVQNGNVLLFLWV
ncbi:type IV secretion system protein VirB2 [Wolbachia endosymbiont of Brugia malayi]|uniref:TrbC/VirB2 family protein n=1 Tax=Wolbachia endosymbiont of Brugia malayi TaxID=80849 RepID=UPI00109D54C7|nr:type IV secretion system protein VirB2 [Wolbachia endosymbiont of Brugia malayi]